MFSIKKHALLGSSALAAAGFLVSANTAQADLAKCGKKLEGIELKMASTITKALNKCLDAARGGDTGADLASACDGAIGKANAAVAKNTSSDPAALGKIQGLSPATCTNEDLITLGLGASGVNSPGTGNAANFAATYLAKRAEQTAWSLALATGADARNLMDSAVAASAANPTACDGAACANLNAYSAAQQPACRTHACELTAMSGATLQPLGVPVTLGNRIFPLDVCTLPSTGLPVTAPTQLLSAGVVKTFDPPPTIPLSPVITVCVQQLRGAGWVDCSGLGVATNPTLCRDHNVNTDAEAPDDECTGAAAVGATADACTAVSPGCPHTGVENGKLSQTFAGASVLGDASLNSITQFKLLPAGVCLTGATPNGGTCTPPSTMGCPMGSTLCIPTTGADGTACTGDDLLAPNSPTTVPFTTGTATATIYDYSNTDGVTQTFNIGPGTPIASCGAMAASNLTGLKLVGAFPALDGATTSDTITTLSIECQ